MSSRTSIFAKSNLRNEKLTEPPAPSFQPTVKTKADFDAVSHPHHTGEGDVLTIIFYRWFRAQTIGLTEIAIWGQSKNVV
jgi:hypothetical protein